MSTPMFIREPAAGVKTNATTGNPFTLFSAVTEATLVEEVRFTGASTNTNASLLYIYLYDPDAAVDVVAQLIDIPAPGASAYAYVAADVNITIPVGWSMKVLHTLTDGGGNVNADICLLGGIVR